MNAFYFGPSSRQLFGAYDPPQGGGRSGVVVCYPWAREYLLAHSTLRHFAKVLAARGRHVLRFDYSGTGDSAGELSDADPEQWFEDIGTAIEELKDIAQIARVALVGMRYGGAMAARAAQRRPDIERLVLWDPVLDGHRYLLEVGARAALYERPDQDVLGVVLTARARVELEAMTMHEVGPGLPETLVLNTSRAGNAYDPLITHLRESGVACSTQHVPDVQVWSEEWGRGGVGMAVAATNAIAGWLA